MRSIPFFSVAPAQRDDILSADRVDFNTAVSHPSDRRCVRQGGWNRRRLMLWVVENRHIAFCVV